MLLAAALALAAAWLLLALPLLPGRKAEAPGGEFVAVASSSLLLALWPAMPGQGGDKPGRIAIVRRAGGSCGSIAVPMVSMIAEIVWELDARPRRARIGWWARWNLDACAVDFE